jgi:predicted amidophosphoribosyltransferase
MIRWLKDEKGGEIVRYLAYILSCGIRTETRFQGKADFMVPVPPDPRRRQERGFNNVAQLARDMEPFCALPNAEDLLVKVKTTDDLRQLGRHERRSELSGSIAVNPRHARWVKDTTVLLVDDTVTSGTTLDTCAQVLKAAGAAEVLAATLARSESTQQTERAAERLPDDVDF